MTDHSQYFRDMTLLISGMLVTTQTRLGLSPTQRKQLVAIRDMCLSKHEYETIKGHSPNFEAIRKQVQSSLMSCDLPLSFINTVQAALPYRLYQHDANNLTWLDWSGLIDRILGDTRFSNPDGRLSNRFLPLILELLNLAYPGTALKRDSIQVTFNRHERYLDISHGTLIEGSIGFHSVSDDDIALTETLLSPAEILVVDKSTESASITVTEL